MPATYEPIATTTLGSNAATITFSAISSAYTDLRLVLVSPGFSANDFPNFRINNDTGTTYSLTRLRGDSSTTTSSRMSTVTNWQPMNAAITSGISFFLTLDINSYSLSTINKTGLITYSANENTVGNVGRCIALYRANDVIDRIDIRTNNGNSYTTGTTATLYGILKA